jgi:transposase
MSQSLLYHAFGVRQGYEYWRTEYADGCIRFFLLVKPELLVCPGCQSREVSRKGRRFRELQTVPIGLKPVFLVTEVPKCQCRKCGQRFEVAPLLPRRMPATRSGSKRSSAICVAS